jgi:hypothetical protein
MRMDAGANQRRPGAIRDYLPGWKALATEPKIREGWFVPESLNALILLGAAAISTERASRPATGRSRGKGKAEERRD